MREEIGGHEGAVAVAADGDAIAVGDAAAHEFVDGGLGAGDELRDVGVVGLGLAFADDRHGRIVEHGVAGEEERQRPERAHPDEAVGRVLDLARGIGALNSCG